MQDKEFDRLFNSKLGDLEMEPSPMVWDNIADELHGKKGKRGTFTWLSIAASVLVLVSAGLLFFRDTEKIYLRPAKQDEVVKVDNKTTEATVTTEPVTETPIQQLPTVARSVVKATTTKSIKQAATTSATPETNTPLPVEQPVLAVATPKVQTQPAMTVPDIGTPLAITSTEPQVIQTITTVTTIEEPVKTPTKRHGIRSLGGLVNAIVAKVDKRQDKLIEFTENGDEGSDVTGLNLGLIKIKKQ